MLFSEEKCRECCLGESNQWHENGTEAPGHLLQEREAAISRSLQRGKQEKRQAESVCFWEELWGNVSAPCLCLLSFSSGFLCAR